MFCKYCGKEISDSADVCIFCGKRTSEYDNSSHITNQSIRQNDKRKVGIGEILGMAIAVLGILAIVYCGISMRDDTIPYGLYGIRANYQWPLNTYEKQQVFKLVLSVLVFLCGITLWAVGRNTPSYALHVFLFCVIVIIAVAIVGVYMIKSGEEHYNFFGLMRVGDTIWTQSI